MKSPPQHNSMKQQIRYRSTKNQLYQVLDLNKNSSIQDVKRSYKKLALRFHPDKNTTQGAKQVFNKITNAYSKLSNQESKAEYDEKNQRKNKPQFNFRTNFQKSPFSSSSSYYQRFSNANFKKFESQFQQRQKQKKRQEFQKQTQQMQKQFAKLFSKFFQNRKNNEKSQKQKKAQYQRNQQKQNIQRQKRRYEQQRKAKLRKQRIQKQQNKKKTILTFFLILFITIIFGPYLMQSLTSKPIFSHSQTNYYNYQRKTPFLNFTYFVCNKYYSSDTSLQARSKIDDFMNKKYFNSLKRQCISAKNQKKSFEQRAFKQKIGKRRQYFMQKSKSIDDYSCDVLFDITVLHPQYVNKLNQ